MDKKLNNVVELYKKVEYEDQIKGMIEELKETNESSTITNCMIVTIDDDNVVTYSYANLNKNVTMIGALETLKSVFMEDVFVEAFDEE